MSALRLRSIAALLPVALLSSAFTGCAGFSDISSDDLRGRDRSALHTSGRFVLDVWNVRARREDGKGGGAPARAPWGPVSIEFSADTASGDFTSPANTNAWTKSDYDLLEAHVAARSGIVFGDAEQVVVRALLGVGWNHASFDVEQSSAPTTSRSSNRIGVMTGAELSFQPWSRLRLYGRSTAFFSIDTNSQKAELGLEYALAKPNIFVHAGWRHWSYLRDDLSILPGTNNADIASQGFLIGLGLRF